MQFPLLKYQCLHFSQLTLDQLYALMHLRQAVFVLEQDCPYIDADGKDPHCYHVLGYDRQGQLQACARLVPLGISYPHHASIGRIVTSSAIRGHGYGKTLVATSIQHASVLFPSQPLKISAQSYLLRFYQAFGFQPTGEEYLEDGIPHAAMLRPVE